MQYIDECCWAHNTCPTFINIQIYKCVYSFSSSLHATNQAAGCAHAPSSGQSRTSPRSRRTACSNLRQTKCASRPHLQTPTFEIANSMCIKTAFTNTNQPHTYTRHKLVASLSSRPGNPSRARLYVGRAGDCLQNKYRAHEIHPQYINHTQKCTNGRGHFIRGQRCSYTTSTSSEGSSVLHRKPYVLILPAEGRPNDKDAYTLFWRLM